MSRMEAGNDRGKAQTSLADTAANSGWVCTYVVAKAVRVSPRTISRYIERGELEAKSQAEGVSRAWRVSVGRPARALLLAVGEDGPTEDRQDGAADGRRPSRICFGAGCEAGAEGGRGRATVNPFRVDRLGAKHGRPRGTKATRGKRVPQRGAADGAGQGALGAVARAVIFETTGTIVLGARSVAAEGGRDAS